MFDLSNKLNGLKITGLQSINIEISIDYNELTDVGRWPGVDNQALQNIWRHISLPISVTASFTGVARQDFPQQINNDGTFFTKATNFNTALGKPAPATNASGDATEWNVADRPILITALKENGSYFIWDLGNHNYVADISTSGGDTGGGNVETSISYQNDFSEAVLVKNTSVQSLTYDGPY